MILFVFLASTVLSGCVLQEYKSCTGGGTRQEITDFNRQSHEGDGKFMDCLKQCEYYGIDGCCQLDVDSGKCWFSKDGRVKNDNMKKKVMVSEYGEFPVRYAYKSQRKGGMCKWSGHLTQIKDSRKNQCDWNGSDKVGRKQKSGSCQDYQCWDWCFSDKDCVFAQFKNGQCRGFQTCTELNAYIDNGYEVWQKVDQEAPTEPQDSRWAGQRCDDDCIKYAKEWIGDGACDHDACAQCSAYTKNGVFDGGDCAAETNALAYEAGASSRESPIIINLMAAFGFAVTLYGAFRHYTK